MPCALPVSAGLSVKHLQKFMECVEELFLFYSYDCFRILSGRQLSSDQGDDVFHLLRMLRMLRKKDMTMQAGEVSTNRSRGAKANWLDKPSNSGSTVRDGTHKVQRQETQETLAVATRPPEENQPVRSSDQLAISVKSLKLRDIQPKHYKVDLGRSDLPINYPLPGWKFPQEDIPHPEYEPDLDCDAALGDWLQKPGSIDFIRSQLAERRKAIAEDKADSFTFEPLMTTLGNMKKFVCHIGSGRHFGADQPLTDSDRTALDWLEKRADVLLKQKAPYALTVHLAFAFLAVYEVMLGKRVTVPRDRDGGCRWRYTLSARQPHEITAYRWGGNNTTGPKSRQELYDRVSLCGIDMALGRLLHQTHILLYPSFQPLGIGDFCGFGHLPVYPIGMMTNYACNADGVMYGPLQFAMHDIGHAGILNLVEVSDSPARVMLPTDAMRSSEHRLILRQMLLNASSPVDLKPGLRILQFHLLHETIPEMAAKRLENDNLAFPRCLKVLLDALRRRRAGYPPDDLKMSDTQAARAALWGARLLCHWRAAGFKPLSQAQLDLCAGTFETQDGPLLQQHLDFIARHRGSLRQMFIGGYSQQIKDKERHYRSETAFGRGIGAPSCGRMTLFDSIDSDAGLCHVDNIDLAYFVALTSSAMRSEMQQCTGAELPDGIVFASEVAQP